MEKLFYPDSIVIFGLSAKQNNLSRLILGNLLRWGYSGRIFGIHPKSEDLHVDGIRIYKQVEELPEIPDLAVTLLPAKFIPGAIQACGEFGIKRMAIPAGGFNEAGEEGRNLADQAVAYAKKYGVRFIGPNGLTVVNTANGLCLPFIPLHSMPKGGMSVITQSGGFGIFLWNLMADENIGLAKFASIGNKLDLTEVDFLKYFAKDPETKIICLYVESIIDGRALLEAAAECDKPIVLYKANTTGAGNRTAMSHTAAISNDEDIIDAALERAGIIRIYNFNDFISVAKAFNLPPMKGNRIMAMSPAGGFSVVMADLCDKAGFEFAEPGEAFYEEVSKYGNTDIINVSNPLDMGSMYDPQATVDIFHLALHNENIDGAVYINQRPRMPVGDDIFTRMFHTDISKETMGAIRSADKPLGVCLFGPSKTITKIKNNLFIPIFDTPEEMIKALKVQQQFYARQDSNPFVLSRPEGIDKERAAKWLTEHSGVCGEEMLELLNYYGIPVAQSAIVKDVEDAVRLAEQIGYPVVMKVVSPDAVHKSEAGGVLLGIDSAEEVRHAFSQIQSNLFAYNPKALFEGVRVMEMAEPGYDMFVGGRYDESFGPIVFFGYGGIYIEVFTDNERALCPSSTEEIVTKIQKLKSYAILKGTRGQQGGDIDLYVDLILRVSWLLADFPEIQELDLNPVRIVSGKSVVLALDARARVV